MMKNYWKRALLFLVLFVLCGCSGNFSKIDLQNAIELPENGIVEQRTFEQIQKENAIAVFNGTSNGISYEWTVFGSDLGECRDVNLKVDIEAPEKENENNGNAVKVIFAEQSPLGFPALLSIHLTENWDAQSATVYQNEQPVASVSITGTKETILNFSVNETLGTCMIIADENDADYVETEMLASANETEASELNENTEAQLEEKSEHSEENAEVDSYLSSIKDQTASTDVYVSKSSSAQKDTQNGVNSGDNESDDQKESSSNKNKTNKTDNYLSAVQNSSGRVYSDGKQTEKDKYSTDPIPEGKPMPVEPEDQEVDDEKTYTCTFSIECATILNNLDELDPDKLEMVPSNGVILKKKKVKFSQGESVFDVLQRICQDEGIHMEASWTPIYNSAYIEGINNLYEFDCGSESGWMYRVNGWYPNYGSSRYQLQDGDAVEWRFTCNLGKDIGGGYAVGN